MPKEIDSEKYYLPSEDAWNEYLCNNPEVTNKNYPPPPQRPVEMQRNGRVRLEEPYWFYDTDDLMEIARVNMLDLDKQYTLTEEAWSEYIALADDGPEEGTPPPIARIHQVDSLNEAVKLSGVPWWFGVASVIPVAETPQAESMGDGHRYIPDHVVFCDVCGLIGRTSDINSIVPAGWYYGESTDDSLRPDDDERSRFVLVCSLECCAGFWTRGPGRWTVSPPYLEARTERVEQTIRENGWSGE